MSDEMRDLYWSVRARLEVAEARLAERDRADAEFKAWLEDMVLANKEYPDYVHAYRTALDRWAAARGDK